MSSPSTTLAWFGGVTITVIFVSLVGVFLWLKKPWHRFRDDEERLVNPVYDVQLSEIRVRRETERSVSDFGLDDPSTSDGGIVVLRKSK